MSFCCGYHGVCTCELIIVWSSPLMPPKLHSTNSEVVLQHIHKTWKRFTVVAHMQAQLRASCLFEDAWSVVLLGMSSSYRQIIENVSRSFHCTTLWIRQTPIACWDFARSLHSLRNSAWKNNMNIAMQFVPTCCRVYLHHMYFMDFICDMHLGWFLVEIATDVWMKQWFV